ncbi:HGL113Wp [Eremothecium sinecaudum]|uniref:HGL113Wp n=1 Tax=Eremothecium sinecaudum TaxID=45286 RepID=A0A0X8HVH4_9SACH|nr:HGL113Wp [Eremothecium sinecaudum]AMD22227.1 HGL113Wp [Eremothecium sinecaudum]
MFKTATLRASQLVRPRYVLSKPIGLGWTSIRYSSNNSVTPNVSSEIQSTLPSFDTSTVDQLTQVAGNTSDQIGYLSSIGMANSWVWPTGLLQNVLEHVHVYAGLPWWGTICTVTILVRLLLFPLYVKYSDNIGKTTKIKPELDAINAKLLSSSDTVNTQMLAVERKRLLLENGIKNRYLIVPVLQLPLAISFFSGLRQMANYPVEGFSTQGILWFTDLSQADPYLGLQCLAAAMFVSLSRLGGESGAQQFSPLMKKVFTFLPLLSIPATMSLSSGVVLYLAVNAFCSFIQTTLLRNAWVRRKLNITESVKHAAVDPNAPQKGIIQLLKDNIRSAKEQAEKRAEMKVKAMDMEKAIKQQKLDSRIKIVQRSQLKKK